MSTIPIRRKRLLGLPPWVLPALIAVVLLTGWMLLADDDTPDTDVVEAGPEYATVPEAEVDVVALPADPPPGAPLPGTTTTTTTTTTSGGTGEPVDAATQAAIRAGQAAGTAAARAAAARVAQGALATVADVGRTIRESAATAGALSGRAVQITNVRVTEVLSDRAFIVGSGSDRMTVIMDPTGGDAPVRAGETVSISGALETYAPGPSESGAMRDAGQSGYVIATRPGGIDR